MALQDKFNRIVDDIVEQGSNALKNQIDPAIDYFLNQAQIDKVLDFADNLNSVADYFLSQAGNLSDSLNNIADYLLGGDLEGRVSELASHILDKIIPSELSSLVDEITSMADFVSEQTQEQLETFTESPELPDADEEAASARTEDVAALVNVKSGERFMFHFNPEPIQDSKENNIAEINIPGMSHPRLQFTNGGNRTLSFTAFFHYGVEGKEVPYSVSVLQSWLYPEYDGERMTSAPPKLKLVYGETWQDQKWIMKSCRITRQRFDKELKCILAQADIELIEFVDKSIDMRDVQINE